MPEWLRTLLIILVVLGVLYLIAVVAQIILAKILRRQAEPMRASIAQAQRAVAEASSKLETLAPAINGGPREMPFGPLYDQARLLLKRGLANVNEVRNQLSAITARDIPERPWPDAFKLVPMSTEILRRWQARRDVKAVSVHLTEVNETLTRIQQIQSDIATIPRREKDALLQLQQRAAQAAAMIESETRARRPLVEERSILKEVNAHLDQADKLLAVPEPSQAAVITAYPLRMKAGEELQALDKLIATAVEQRTAAESSLAKANELSSAFTSAIRADEQAGCVRSRFAAAADRLIERVATARQLVEQGDYTSAMSALAEIEADLTAQRDALTMLNEERTRVEGLADKADQHLRAVQAWITETPARFERDVAGAAAHQLEALSEQLRALIPIEEIERMAEATELDRQVEAVFTRASHANDTFIAARKRFEELIGKLSEESVQSLKSATARIASELGKANRSYWGDLTPEAITTAAGTFTSRWQEMRKQLDMVRESELSEVLGQVEDAARAFDQAGALYEQAVKALTQLDADRLQASTALNDDTMAKLLDDIGQIAVESPSLAEQPTRIRARAEELRGELQTPAPDYKLIYANAERLRREAESFVTDYRQQLQQVRNQLGLLRYRLEETRSNLKRLSEDPRIDFAALVEPLDANIGQWLAGYESAAAAPLDAAREALADGEGLEREALDQLSSATAASRAISDKIGFTKMTVAELNGVVSSAQAGLHAMAEIGGERWGQPMLAPIHERLDETLHRLGSLDQPESKLPLREAHEALAQIEALMKDLREQATTVQADIARRVAEVHERKAQLAKALADGESAVAANPALAEEWRLVRQQISGLEMRWTNATSYAEGLEAMTQAIQRAHRFIGSAQAQP